MADSTFWWLMAGGMVAVELLSGTFYLLMVAFGFMAAALSAQAGAPLPSQLVAAALVSGGLVLAWRSYKKRAHTPKQANANADVNMDIGGVIDIEHWDAASTAQVKYRGANWQVSLAEGDAPVPGKHQIIQVIGSRLVVKKI